MARNTAVLCAIAALALFAHRPTAGAADRDANRIDAVIAQLEKATDAYNHTAERATEGYNGVINRRIALLERKPGQADTVATLRRAIDHLEMHGSPLVSTDRLLTFQHKRWHASMDIADRQMRTLASRALRDMRSIGLRKEADWAQSELDNRSVDAVTDIVKESLSRDYRIERALMWLELAQLRGGGWDEARNLKVDNPYADPEKQPRPRATRRPVNRVARPAARTGTVDIGETALAGLAFVRAGNTMSHGQYATTVRRTADLLIARVKLATGKSLVIDSGVRSASLQSKLGRTADTFLVAMFLGELRHSSRERDDIEKIDAAMAKLTGIIEKHQTAEHVWPDQAGAPTLRDAMIVSSLRSMHRGGVVVPVAVMRGSAAYMERAATIDPAVYESDVVVTMRLAAVISAEIEHMKRIESPGEILDDPAQLEVDPAADALSAGRPLAFSRERALKLLERVGNDRLWHVADGEHYLSLMIVTEAMYAHGPLVKERWREKIELELDRYENPDGSYRASGCINGNTPGTAGVILALLADRAP